MTGIFKVIVAVGSQIQIVDAIAYEGGVWLVPAWLDQPSTGLQKPMRIIRVDQLERKTTTPMSPAAFFLREPMPIELFDVQRPPAEDSGFVVIDLPPILLNADGSPSDQGIDLPLTRQ